MKDYAATVEAIQGLREAYPNEPPSRAIEALRDERREIRLAGALALASQADLQATRDSLLKTSSNDSDLRFRVAATRALWAVGVLEKARLGKTKAAQLFRKGDLRSAARVVTQFYGTYFGSTFVFPTSRADYSSTLEAGLSVSKPLKVQSGVSTTSSAAVVFKDAFELDDADLSRLVSEINTATGEKSAALDNLESLVSVHPDLRSFLAADPDLKALRDIYEFRVLTGLQQPIEVDDLKLPEEHTARPSSDGTARKN